MKYGDCAANLRHCLRFPSLLGFLGVPGYPGATDFPVLDHSVRQSAWSIPALFDANGLFTIKELGETETAKFIVVGFDFATILLSPSCSCTLFAIVLIVCEIYFCKDVCKLCLVSTYLIWIFGVQINAVKQPIKSNSVGFGYTSHCWTPAFDYHLNDGFVILKDVQHRTKSRKLRVRWHTVNIVQIKIVVLGWNLCLLWLCWFDVVSRDKFLCTLPLVLLSWFGEEWNTSTTKSQRSRAGITSMRKPASREIISASVQLWATDVCFLDIQLFGTNAWLPKMHKRPPDVNVESSRSLAKSESWDNPNLHCCAVFPRWQYCLNHMCGEWKKSSVPSVCHMLWSI